MVCCDDGTIVERLILAGVAQLVDCVPFVEISLDTQGGADVALLFSGLNDLGVRAKMGFPAQTGTRILVTSALSCVRAA